MKTAQKIIIAGIIGTSFMTLYSYYRSNKEKQQYREPVLLNKLINRSRTLPVKLEENSAVGWATHYSIGVMFVLAYYLLCRRALQHPTPSKALLIGSGSGIVAIASWKIMFIMNPNPPDNHRYGYYRQLFVAHVVFAAFALAGYRFTGFSLQNAGLISSRLQ